MNNLLLFENFGVETYPMTIEYDGGGVYSQEPLRIAQEVRNNHESISGWGPAGDCYGGSI